MSQVADIIQLAESNTGVWKDSRKQHLFCSSMRPPWKALHHSSFLTHTWTAGESTGRVNRIMQVAMDQ